MEGNKGVGDVDRILGFRFTGEDGGAPVGLAARRLPSTAKSRCGALRTQFSPPLRPLGQHARDFGVDVLNEPQGFF